MPLLTSVSSLVRLVQSSRGRHPCVWHRGGQGAEPVASRWPLLYQDGATVQTSVVSAQGPYSSAWHGCRECPLGCGTFGLGSPGTCSGKEPNVHFLM